MSRHFKFIAMGLLILLLILCGLIILALAGKYIFFLASIKYGISSFIFILILSYCIGRLVPGLDER